MKTLQEFYNDYISRRNPITGEYPLYKDITDQMIWDEAYKAGRKYLKELNMSEKTNEFERVSEEVVLIDGKHYRVMSDEEVASFVWS